MTYKPTAEDFNIPDEQQPYTPSAEDFDQEPSESEVRKPLELEVTKDIVPKEKTGWKAVGEDAINMLRHSLKSGLGFARRTPGNLKEIGSELIHHPLSYPPHVAQQVLAALGEGGKGLLNLPHEGIAELGKRDVIPDWLKKYNELPFTHIPEDTGTEKLLGLESTKKSDELIRALPAILGGGKALAAPVGAAKKAVTAPSKETLFKRALESRIEEAADKIGVSQKDLTSLKESLRRDYSDIHKEKLGEVTPIGQEEAINVKRGKLEKLQPLTEIPEEKVGEIPEAPDTQAIIDKKKAALENATDEAEKVVGIKDNPRLQGGEKVKKAIEEVKDKASALYNAARKHYVDKKVKVDNSKELKSVGNELDELSANESIFEGTSSEREALQTKIDSLQGETVNASDLFDMQRTLETMAENTRQKQYASGKGTTKLERKHFRKVADRLENHAKFLEKQLESVGGKEVQSMMKDANKGWAIYKNLEKRNPVGKGALKGELPTRSMVEIAKSHPGNDFLSALIESDPELKKHVLAAYTGESNVTKLIKPTSLAKKYIQDLPEVEEHVNALKQALTGVKEGEIQASKVKKEYSDLVKSMTEAAETQKSRADAIQKSDKLKQQIKFIEDAIPKLKEKISKVDENTAEHARLKKELSDHEKNLADKNHLLKKITSIVLKFTGASSLLHKAGL